MTNTSAYAAYDISYTNRVPYITRDEYKQGVRDIEQRIDDLRDDLGIDRRRK